MLALLLLLAGPAPVGARDLLPAERDGPGCALDVRRDGQVIEAGVTGLANLEDGTAIRPDTVFEIGSVSKQFIGAGLALLAQRGSLAMTDPISKWLPELPPLYRGVTVQMLAHHTSGIRSWNNLAELTGRGEDSTGYDNAWVLAAIARQHALNNVPGTEYLYSNSNFVLGAIIIERASRQSLNDFFRDAFFKRLGMSRTEWRTDFTKVMRDRAQAYLPNGHGGWQLDMPLNNVAGAGALLSTVADLQRWNATLADPSSEDRSWVAALLKPGVLTDGTELRYGLGIESDPIVGLPAWSHAGSTGSYRGWLGYVPSQRLSIALLCNSGGVNTEDLGPQIAARFLPAAGGTTRPPTSTTALVPGIAGIYRNVANDAVVEVEADSSGVAFNRGARFVSASTNQLVSRDGRRTAMLIRDRSGVVTGITVARTANAPTTLVRETSWRPTARELARLTGSYSSVEVDGVQRIEIHGAGLIWRDPSGATHPLVAVYKDGFEAPDASWTLRFRRSAGGRVDLDMSITRARRIAFARISETLVRRTSVNER